MISTVFKEFSQFLTLTGWFTDDVMAAWVAKLCLFLYKQEQTHDHDLIWSDGMWASASESPGRGDKKQKKQNVIPLNVEVTYPH